MEDYKTLVRDLIEDHIDDTTKWHLRNGETISREDILKELQDDTQNVFGNIDGSRTCSTHEAQRFLDQSGAIWDDDIHDLFDDMGENYFYEQLKRGAETLDVTICELLAPQIIDEMLDESDE
jgi:hypothetical protein